MKTTDLAMIFVAILIPIIVVVYVDVSFLLKKEEQTLYYTNIINSAINDATYAMKNVEGEDQDVDYGYSGLSEKRVSVNARIAVKTFYDSLYDDFNVKTDTTSEAYIKSHVPALAVIDYNGVYIYSIDEYKDTESRERYTDYVLKPKRYFTYTYAISGNEIIESDEFASNGGIQNLNTITVQFTMDDYISVIGNDGIISSFYLEDNTNNQVLYAGNTSIRDKVVQHLRIKRSEVISDIVSKEMSFAVNNHNLYSDVDYQFVFPTIALSDWEEMVDNVGIIAFIQGINIGNTTLDYVAHGISGLKMTSRYYVSKATSGVSSLDYYHETPDCSVYINSNKTFVGYYMTKLDAASAGYYPCPVCTHTVAKNIGGSGTMPQNQEEIAWEGGTGEVNVSLKSGVSATKKGVKIGDYVNYTPTAKTSSTYKVGQTNKYFATQTGASALRWRYMGVDTEGNALLVADRPTTDSFYLYGKGGYVNGPTVLNALCNELYSSPLGDARSIDTEDIAKLLGSNYYGQYIRSSDGMTVSVSAGLTIGELRTLASEQGLTHMYTPEIGKNIYDDYTVSKYICYEESIKKLYPNETKLVFRNSSDLNVTYWLASRAVYPNFHGGLVGFGLEKVGVGGIPYDDLFLSNNITGEGVDYIRPVIVLKDNVEFISKDASGNWNIQFRNS